MICAMDVSSPHNLNRPAPEPDDLRFGVRVGLPPTDPYQHLLGSDWERTLWYRTRRERDEALYEMGKRHPFNRIGDRPSITLEAIER